MDPIADALLAVMASRAGDTPEAHHHLEAARRHAQRCARRHRQLVDIAGLIVSGARDRADGLTLVHVAEFAEDAELLAHLVAGSGTAAPDGAQRSTG